MVQTARKIELVASPFLKWAGGKSKLLPHILPLLPERISTYYEPFIGGGAVFFALASQRRFKRAVIADKNPELVEAYTAVRDKVDELIDLLGEHGEYATDSDYFYEVRAIDTKTLSKVQRAARLIFLNKTCFNGLYRVNRSGQFNVPFGKYKNPRVCNEVGLRAASSALRGVDILERDFESVARLARRRDAIYFDPPYVPLSTTSSFTAYAAAPFGEEEHRRLVRIYRECCARGAAAVLSNSDCRLTRKIYEGLEYGAISAARAINSVASKRGPVSELLVSGVKPRVIQKKARTKRQIQKAV